LNPAYIAEGGNGSHPVRHLFGVPIHALSMEQVLGEVDRAIGERRPLLIGVVNAAKLVNMHRSQALGDSVRSADLILADGMAVVWACRLLRRRLPERVAGIDLMERMLEQARLRGHRVFCLGATQEILEQAVGRMRERHPGVQIVGQHNGYFAREEEARVAEEIRRARPDILFVAMTSPKKEEFLARWSRHMEVPVCHGVGGAFDVVAGKVRRAPRIWQRVGLEWLYRVVQEPRRMWKRYLVTNTLFCGMLVREMVSRPKPAPAERETT
jgi:N-acetylglucosaminyldiphosphoundecaprenol N-acetyl-beta-D-mannosaminyltransferase